MNQNNWANWSKIAVLKEMFPQIEEAEISKCLARSGNNVNIVADQLAQGPSWSSSSYGAAPKQTPATAAVIPLSTDPNKKRNSNTRISSELTKTPHNQPKIIPPHKASFPQTTAADDDDDDDDDTQEPSLKKSYSQTEFMQLTSTARYDLLKTTQNPSTANESSSSNAYYLKQQSRPRKLLLCQRFVMGCSTSRKGSIETLEPISFSTSASDKQQTSWILRFQGKQIQGTLDRTLGVILSPLLHQSLILLEGESITQDSNSYIGKNIPIQVRVYLTGDLLFQVLQTQQPPGGGILQSSALALLHWAEYGEEVVTPLDKDSMNNEKDDTSAQQETMEDEEIAEDEQNLDEYNDIQRTNDLFVPKLSFGAGGENVFSSKEDDTIEEMVQDPEALVQKGTFLLPHQKYALYWMMQREQWCHHHQQQKQALQDDDGMLVEKSVHWKKASAEVNQLDLEILRQLLQPHGTQDLYTCSSLSSYFLTNGDVSCDIGPIRVSEAMSASAKTLDEVEDPILDHVLWKKRFLWDTSDPTIQNKVYSFYVNEMMNQVSTSSPTRLRQAVGGILADEMGLGKSVMMLALIAKVKESERQIASLSKEASSPVLVTGPTLIVAPLSMLPQWQDEIESKTTMSVYIYYNNCKKGDVDLSRYDIALTTYGTLQSEFSIKTKNGRISSNERPLFAMHWKRVILDEAHLIKNPKTAVAKASFALNAEARWCLTGTPLQNSLDDIYSLLRFIRHEPWSDYGLWKRISPSQEKCTISAPTAAGAKIVDQKLSLERVKMVLSCLILRRTKQSLSSQGCRLLKLPDIDFQTISVHLTERERSFYEALRTKSQSIFQMYVDAGVATKSWFQIFSLLQRLRQACDHMALTAPSRLDTLSDGDLSTVAVEECTDADVAKLNILDTACIVATPFCEDVNDPFRFVEDGPSAKLQAILDELEKVWTNHPNCKVLIFSQYLGFLDLLEKPLQSYKIQTLRLEGKMSMRERQQSLNSFAHAKGREVVFNNNSKSVQSGCVFLMSMKAGGVGLNLTCASCVFIADPWWHAAMDEQCINRVHRIGQKANVVLVRKFIVEDSVEEKILILQKRKKALSSQILGDHISQLDGQGKSNPTLDDFNILFGR